MILTLPAVWKENIFLLILIMVKVAPCTVSSLKSLTLNVLVPSISYKHNSRIKDQWNWVTHFLRGQFRQNILPKNNHAFLETNRAPYLRRLGRPLLWPRSWLESWPGPERLAEQCGTSWSWARPQETWRGSSLESGWWNTVHWLGP